MARAKPSWAISATFRACAFVQGRVGGDDAQRRPVLAGAGGERRAERSSSRASRVPCRRRCDAAITLPWRIDHVADRVPRDQRRDDEAVGQHQRRRSDPGLHRPARLTELAHRRAGPGAERCLATASAVAASRRGSRSPARAAPRACRRTRGHQDRRRHDGHPACRRSRSRSCAVEISASAPPRGMRPKALPPESTMAWTRWTLFDGSSSSMSRVPGAPRARRRRRRRRPAPVTDDRAAVGRSVSVWWPTVEVGDGRQPLRRCATAAGRSPPRAAGERDRGRAAPSATAGPSLPTWNKT